MKLERLADSAGERHATARVARERILRWFTWERKAEQIAVAKVRVLGSASKPVFATPFP